MESTQKQMPSEHCKFIFAVFGINISKRKEKGLWKILKSRLRDREGIARALDGASKISQKTNQEFNLTNAETVSSNDLKQMQTIVIQHFTRLRTIRINQTRSSPQKNTLFLRLIAITTNKINEYLCTINQKWLRYYGIINSEVLKITGCDHFVQIQNESKKFKRENCEKVIAEALSDSSISLPST